MYLKQIPNKKAGRTFLAIVEPYLHKESGNTRTKTVLSLGYLEDLIKEMEDPIAHYKQVAKEMTKERNEMRLALPIKYKPNEKIDATQVQRKNLGYAALSKIYHELGLQTFTVNRQRNLKIEYSLNEILKMLVFQRILDPGSKKYMFERKDRYFEKYDFSLADTYRSLSRLASYTNTLLVSLHKSVTKNYGRDASNVFYDVTNYYFEIEDQDDLRRKGVSKEHRPDPIVQLGLLMDNNGLPITYKLFSGNTNDCNTLIPVLMDIRKEYGIGRMVVVADKGLNTGENIACNLIQGDGYVYSQTIRGATKELKDYVLDTTGYRKNEEGFKIKSRLSPREITVTDIQGKKVKVPIDEKQVIFYSEKYARRAKAEREPTLLKACKLINNPGKYNKETSYGAAKYVKNLVFDKKTGEILTVGHRPQLDLEKLRQEELFDGYYAIVTSEYKMSDEEIIDTYRGLWKIEESFRITKSELEARPVYVSREDHIQAHFLICFISLLILRILEMKTDRKFSPARLIESMSRASGSPVDDGLYLFDHYDEILNVIGDAVNLDFSRKYLRIGEIKKMLAATKKP